MAARPMTDADIAATFDDLGRRQVTVLGVRFGPGNTVDFMVDPSPRPSAATLARCLEAADDTCTLDPGHPDHLLKGHT